MEEPHEAIVGAIQRAPCKCRDVGRPDQSMASDNPDDLHITIGKSESWRLGCTTKPRHPCLCSDSGGIHIPKFYHALSRQGAAGRGQPWRAEPATGRRT